MNILAAENVKSLGVTLDSCLTLNKHVSAVCSAASLHIRNIGKIRHLLTQSITEKLVHAFITARLDYCNSIMYGLPKKLIQRLQHIQNTASRLVTRTNRDDHLQPPTYSSFKSKHVDILLKLFVHVDIARLVI